MAYSDFTLRELKQQFGVDNKVVRLFDGAQIGSIEISTSLREDLQLATQLPIRSEKAKSELIVMPILLELMKRNELFFTIYSGENLNADRNQGLAGECDFILAQNTGSFDINTPIITLVEAKKSDIDVGIPQCAAQMLGAYMYNKTYGNEVNRIYGCVTTADAWVFMMLENNLIQIDNQKYYLGNLEELLGVMQEIINYYKKELAAV